MSCELSRASWLVQVWLCELSRASCFVRASLAVRFGVSLDSPPEWICKQLVQTLCLTLKWPLWWGLNLRFTRRAVVIKIPPRSEQRSGHGGCWKNPHPAWAPNWVGSPWFHLLKPIVQPSLHEPTCTRIHRTALCDSRASWLNPPKNAILYLKPIRFQL